MQLNMATCPHCRAKLGLRTSFTLADLWDPRTSAAIGFRFNYHCYQCGSLLGYPLNTALSFIAFAILPLVMIGISPELKADWSAAVFILFMPYLSTLAGAYSCLAAPVLSNLTSGRKR